MGGTPSQPGADDKSAPADGPEAGASLPLRPARPKALGLRPLGAPPLGAPPLGASRPQPPKQRHPSGVALPRRGSQPPPSLPTADKGGPDLHGATQAYALDGQVREALSAAYDRRLEAEANTRDAASVPQRASLGVSVPSRNPPSAMPRRNTSSDKTMAFEMTAPPVEEDEPAPATQAYPELGFGPQNAQTPSAKQEARAKMKQTIGYEDGAALSRALAAHGVVAAASEDLAQTMAYESPSLEFEAARSAAARSVGVALPTSGKSPLVQTLAFEANDPALAGLDDAGDSDPGDDVRATLAMDAIPDVEVAPVVRPTRPFGAMAPAAGAGHQTLVAGLGAAAASARRAPDDEVTKISPGLAGAPAPGPAPQVAVASAAAFNAPPNPFGGAPEAGAGGLVPFGAGQVQPGGFQGDATAMFTDDEVAGFIDAGGAGGVPIGQGGLQPQQGMLGDQSPQSHGGFVRSPSNAPAAAPSPYAQLAGLPQLARPVMVSSGNNAKTVVILVAVVAIVVVIGAGAIFWLMF